MGKQCNTYFFGTPWYAAERYTDLTKTLFLSLFYSCLIPSGLFLTAFGYAYCYTVDKYSLLRSWRTPAELGDDITKVSRGHMLFAVYAHAAMTMVFFSEFPFDNVCTKDKVTDNAYLDKFVFGNASKTMGVTTRAVHRRCDQTVSGRVVSVFTGGSLVRDSMYGEQRRVVQLYVYVVVGLTFVIVSFFLGPALVKFIVSLFYSSYISYTKATNIHYSDCEIQAYIPIIRHEKLAFPLICCDVRTFDPRYLAFVLPSVEKFAEQFPGHPIPSIGEGGLYQLQSLANRHEFPSYSEEQLGEIFSMIKHYPPPSDLNEEAQGAKRPSTAWAPPNLRQRSSAFTKQNEGIVVQSPREGSEIDQTRNRDSVKRATRTVDSCVEEAVVETKAPVAVEVNSAEAWIRLEQRVMESLFYLGFGSFIFSFLVYWIVLERHLNWLDSLYFTMATYTTISYGDIYPTSVASRIFTIFMVYTTVSPAAC